MREGEALNLNCDTPRHRDTENQGKTHLSASEPRCVVIGSAVALALALLVESAALLAAGSPVVDAVKSGDRAALRALLAQRTDVNAAEADGTTALHYAIQRDDAEMVDLLIEAGADAKAANRYGIAPMHLAATWSGVTPYRFATRARAPAWTSAVTRSTSSRSTAQ